jgi:hypothetical protein
VDNPESRTPLAVETARRLRGEDGEHPPDGEYLSQANAAGAIAVEDRFDLGLHVKDAAPSYLTV